MNTRKWIAAGTVLGVISAPGFGYAEVGVPNGELVDTSRDIATNLTRAQVRAELSAAKAQGMTGTDVDMIDGRAPASASRSRDAVGQGMAGSRYSNRAGEEVWIN